VRKVIAIVGVIGGLSGCVGYPISPEQRVQLEGLRDQAIAQAKPLDAERTKALIAAHGRVGARPDLGPCPIQAIAPSPEDNGVFQDNDLMFELGLAPYTVVHLADLPKVQGPRLDRLETAVTNDIESMLYHNFAAKSPEDLDRGIRRAKELASPGWLLEDATLVLDDEQLPVIEGNKFQSGHVRGTLYLWSYREHEILCAADVVAESSDVIGVHRYAGTDGSFLPSMIDLKRDLYRQGIIVGVKGLAKPGPKLFTVE
jgi:hypothetical protein